MLLALSGILPDSSSLTNVRSEAGWQHASQSEQNARAPLKAPQRAINTR
jgi:hypothetical protein